MVVPFLDHLLQELTSRFNPENRVGKDIFYLVPTIVINQTDLNEVTKGLMFWQIDMPSSSSLLSELKLWQQHWVHRHTLQGEIPSDLHTSLAICDEDIYPNIHVLLKIGCTLPISLCEAERSFSCYRRVKTSSFFHEYRATCWTYIDAFA